MLFHIKSLEYKSFGIQPYLTCERFSLKQIKLFYTLRSKCYSAKINFKKMNKGNLTCRFLCNSEETQSHIFENCEPIKSKISYPMNINLQDIYGSIDDQIGTIKYLVIIDNVRSSIIEDSLPGGVNARTHVTT